MAANLGPKTAETFKVGRRTYEVVRDWIQNDGRPTLHRVWAKDEATRSGTGKHHMTAQATDPAEIDAAIARWIEETGAVRV